MLYIIKFHSQGEKNLLNAFISVITIHFQMEYSIKLCNNISVLSRFELRCQIIVNDPFRIPQIIEWTMWINVLYSLCNI